MEEPTMRELAQYEAQAVHESSDDEFDQHVMDYVEEAEDAESE